MTFKLSLNTSTIMPVGLMDKIRLTVRHGFDGIELWVNDLFSHATCGGEIRDIEKALQDSGLEVPCVLGMRHLGAASEGDYPMMLDDVIDLPAQIQTLRDVGYRGHVSLELFNADLWAKDPNDVLATAIERMRALLSD
ncbi:MAG: hypothetical protein ACYTGQ_03610 [Planctomycetota bacterium]|jgi:sugar phosphate isomerase/epimerase